MAGESDITLQALTDEDIPLFDKWLDKEYIYKWFCPEGQESRQAWLDEINGRDGKYSFMKHFIVYHDDRRIGYCLYADCFFLKDLEEEGHDFKDIYGNVPDKNHTYEIGYLIGEEQYLNKGIGKTIIRMLEDKIVEVGGKEIASDPDEENIISIKALLSNGFRKKSDGDYRKTIA